MNYLLTGGAVFLNNTFQVVDVTIRDGRIISVGTALPRKGFSVIDFQNKVLVPGFVDVHVHLREPGFCYKETIASGTAAAAAGGYTAVCPMPNLNPVPDCPTNLKPEIEALVQHAVVHVYPYGTITKGQAGDQLADLDGLKDSVCAFSDDGHGVQSTDMMRRAMQKAKALGMPIVAHCEVNDLLTPGGCVHDGAWAKAHDYPGISSESEWKMVERDLNLVRETGCRYHICHISTKESVELIRRAKVEGLPVTCETAPHYLVLCEDDLQEEGRFKMNPPLRSSVDRAALQEGLLDGTIDLIATDHAPHSQEEKDKGLRDSANGIVGLETAFPILYTELVTSGWMTLEQLVDQMSLAPRRCFNLPGGKIAKGEPADLTILDLNRPHAIDSTTFHSKGKATPFDGWFVTAAVAMTLCDGDIVYANMEQEML